MAVLQVTKHNFEEQVTNSEKPVLLDFWADWCPPCRMMAPIVDAVAEDHPEIRVGKVNVDEEQELALQFQVESIPTLVVIRNGAEAARQVGAVPRERLESMLK